MEYSTEKIEIQNVNADLQKSARNYKDSLFVDLFARCPEAKENFLSLYNALHGTDLKFAETKIEPIMLEKTIYKGRYNDVSMLVNDSLIVLVEQQSTVNENMPLRFLEYVSRLYEKLVPLEKRYKEKMIKIPTPEFYVFYNGKKDYPAIKELCLSESFSDNNKKRQEIPIELSVKVYNINKKEVSSILQNCPTLRGYATLVQYAGAAKSDGIQNWLTHAIQRCIKEGILVDYLNRNSTEVRNMLIADYDYDTDIRVKQQEAFEEGEFQAKYETARNLFELGLNPEQIAKATSLPLEKILELEKQLQTEKS